MKKENEVNFEFVDLGLSVKWANMNVGAKDVEDCGKYFAYNEVNEDEGRLPSKEEFAELLERCTWEWIDKDGKIGYVVKSLSNDNSIFLPAAGLIATDEVRGLGGFGYYLSSTKDKNRAIGVYELVLRKGYKAIYFAGSYKRSARLVR